jgi:hypothetical protein
VVAHAVFRSARRTSELVRRAGLSAIELPKIQGKSSSIINIVHGTEIVLGFRTGWEVQGVGKINVAK